VEAGGAPQEAAAGVGDGGAGGLGLAGGVERLGVGEADEGLEVFHGAERGQRGGGVGGGGERLGDAGLDEERLRERDQEGRCGRVGCAPEKV